MVESSDELSEPKDEPREQPLKTQADLVIRKFERLDLYNFASPTDTPIDISIERLRSKQDLLTRLCSSILPQIQHQCARLSRLLQEPTHLHNNPASTLKLIWEIQLNLELTLGQMIQTLDEIFPGRVPEPYQKRDQRFNELKIYRLHRLNSSLRVDLKSRLRILFQNSIKLIEDFKLPVAERRRVIEFADLGINRKIELAIKYVRGSELSLIWELWKDGINSLSRQVAVLLRQMDPIRALHPKGESHLSQPAIKLGRSVLPIFKLSRLFFKKLYRENVKMEEVELFTEMCSHQLFCLHSSIEDIIESISVLSFSVRDADRLAPGDTSSAIIQELNKLIVLFQPHLSLINLYVLPNMFPNHTGLSRQIDFQNWVVDWTNSFLLATHNAIQAVQSFADT
ncbi:hypothetical protein PGT21_017723 [Puccinia graminis f. sp. tritici]|uniref:Uncharacterized protein n=1 Tax=Puccinia graminis f. sp. tritici TaxID=56615 RepID=A0A5B0MKG7_PUCGR|nr:hypothetical protein PGT21_017723 [Puccinia graminis f. sp. tritici]KAA1126923.1 hypothetical protein PGTUg99_031838 [Puccinia graminis f. sp. tritici]